RKYNLREHVKTHDRFRDFPCPYSGCETAFTRRWALKRHWTMKHDDSPPPDNLVTCRQKTIKGARCNKCGTRID
ncbi:hypothetical protein K474DRAFT_1610585, partial [Panus rudis PR-1116 ss-1]